MACCCSALTGKDPRGSSATTSWRSSARRWRRCRRSRCRWPVRQSAPLLGRRQPAAPGPAPPRGCPRCGAGAGDADCGLDALADRLLFEDLAPGERSALFESRTLAQHYPAELLPRFFYVNVGREVARVEMPAWAAAQPPLVERVQAVVVDQCRRGQGYPVAGPRARAGGGQRRRPSTLQRAGHSRPGQPRAARPPLRETGQQARAGRVRGRAMVTDSGGRVARSSRRRAAI